MLFRFDVGVKSGVVGCVEDLVWFEQVVDYMVWEDDFIVDCQGDQWYIWKCKCLWVWFGCKIVQICCELFDG